MDYTKMVGIRVVLKDHVCGREGKGCYNEGEVVEIIRVRHQRFVLSNEAMIKFEDANQYFDIVKKPKRNLPEWW